jgi:hypothetical protein
MVNGEPGMPHILSVVVVPESEYGALMATDDVKLKLQVRV